LFSQKELYSSLVSRVREKASEVSEVWPENGERKKEWVCWVVEEEQGKSWEIG
jgi:hypothetical protein